MSTAIVRTTYKNLNSINLGKEFIAEHKLAAQQKYPIVVVGLDDHLSGTLQKHGLIGGLAAMYDAFPSLTEGSVVAISFDGTTIHITPPEAAQPYPAPSALLTPGTSSPVPADYVLDRKLANRVHIPPYAPGAMNSWEPKGEPDVYMVFGRVAEFTKYRYCCASSKEVLSKLGVSIDPKPDAILIEERTDRYLIAEFEVDSSSFVAHGHKVDDIDVLVCWTNSAKDQAQLPKRILVLRDLIASLIDAGDIEL